MTSTPMQYFVLCLVCLCVHFGILICLIVLDCRNSQARLVRSGGLFVKLSISAKSHAKGQHLKSLESGKSAILAGQHPKFGKCQSSDEPTFDLCRSTLSTVGLPNSAGLLARASSHCDTGTLTRRRMHRQWIAKYEPGTLQHCTLYAT